MKRYAYITNGTISNVILWDGESYYDPGTHVTLINIDDRQEVQIGWSYDGSNFTAPVVPSEE